MRTTFLAARLLVTLLACLVVGACEVVGPDGEGPEGEGPDPPGGELPPGGGPREPGTGSAIELYPDAVRFVVPAGLVEWREQTNCALPPRAVLELSDGRYAVASTFRFTPGDTVQVDVLSPGGEPLASHPVPLVHGVDHIAALAEAFVWVQSGYLHPDVDGLRMTTTSAEGDVLRADVMLRGIGGEAAPRPYVDGTRRTADGGVILLVSLDGARGLVRLGPDGEIVWTSRPGPSTAELRDVVERDDGYLGVGEGEAGGAPITWLDARGEVTEWGTVGPPGARLDAVRALGDDLYVAVGSTPERASWAVVFDDEGTVVFESDAAWRVDVDEVLDAAGGRGGVELVLLVNGTARKLRTVRFAESGRVERTYAWPFEFYEDRVPRTSTHVYRTEAFLPNRSGGASLLASYDDLSWMSGFCTGRVSGALIAFSGEG